MPVCGRVYIGVKVKGRNNKQDVFVCEGSLDEKARRLCVCVCVCV